MSVAVHRTYQVAGALTGGEAVFHPMTLVCTGPENVTIHSGWSSSGPSSTVTSSWFALPALTDVHVHVWNGGVLPYFVPFGVTAVRDAASPPGVQESTRRVSRRRPVPAVVFGGPMVDRSAPRLASAVAWTERDGPVPAVKELAARRPAWIKIYEGLDRDWIRPVVEAIHQAGARAAIHAAPAGVRQADAAGVDSIEHVATLAWDLTGARPARAVGRARFGEVSQLWRMLREDASNGTSPWRPNAPVTTTFSAIYGLTKWLRGVEQILAPGELLAQWSSSPLVKGWTEAELVAAERATEAMAAWCREHVRNGGRLAIGTDSPNPVVPPGQAIWWEIDLMRWAGLHPFDAYRLASVDNLVPTPRGDWIFVERDRAERAARGGSWGFHPVRAVLMRGRLLRVTSPAGRPDLQEVE